MKEEKRSILVLHKYIFDGYIRAKKSKIHLLDLVSQIMLILLSQRKSFHCLFSEIFIPIQSSFPIRLFGSPSAKSNSVIFLLTDAQTNTSSILESVPPNHGSDVKPKIISNLYTRILIFAEQHINSTS